MGRKIAVVAGLVLQALVLVFLYIPSGLVVPVWAWVLAMAVGLAFTAAAGALARRGSLWVLAVPFVSALALYGYVSLGEAVFGWTA